MNPNINTLPWGKFFGTFLLSIFTTTLVVNIVRIQQDVASTELAKGQGVNYCEFGPLIWSWVVPIIMVSIVAYILWRRQLRIFPRLAWLLLGLVLIVVAYIWPWYTQSCI